MSTFKVGDRVRNVGDYEVEDVPIGYEADVEWADFDHIGFDDADGFKRSRPADNYELVQSEPVVHVHEGRRYAETSRVHPRDITEATLAPVPDDFLVIFAKPLPASLADIEAAARTLSVEWNPYSVRAFEATIEALRRAGVEVPE